ncbi:hypothetical protein ALTERO38_80027 [Alteromonas sp. 38]|nr:hypothetical protein ALTER154_10582 [Alteromonas sp. 154]VXC39532.1 hypothetical protein ALTERO38_80027 [Alteromonas sp. 38]
MVNLPFWRVKLLKQRRKMSNLSSKVFAEAKTVNNLKHSIYRMTSEIAVYSCIGSIKKKNLW